MHYRLSRRAPKKVSHSSFALNSSSLPAHRISIFSFSVRFPYPLTISLHPNRSKYSLLSVALHGGLRARTQVPGTPSDGSLSDGSLGDPLTSLVPSRAHHQPTSPAPPSCTPPPAPQQIRNPLNPHPATTDHLFSNANGLTKAHRACVFEMELGNTEQQMG